MEEEKEKVREGSKEDLSPSGSLQESGLGDSTNNGDKGSTPRDQDSGLEDSDISEQSERREGSQKSSKKRSSKREQRKSGRVGSSSELEKTVAGFEDSSALETSDNSELSEKSERSRSSSRGTFDIFLIMATEHVLIFEIRNTCWCEKACGANID